MEDIELRISPAFINRVKHFYYIDVRVPSYEEIIETSKYQLRQYAAEIVARRWRRDMEERIAEEQYWIHGETGDRALDANSDEDLPTTEEYSSEHEDEDESIPLDTIDFTDDSLLDEYFQ